MIEDQLQREIERGNAAIAQPCSVKSLTRETGLSRRSVQRALRELEDAGLMTIVDQPGRTPLYVCTIPPGSEGYRA